MMRRADGSARLMLGFGVASLAAVGTGALICALSGAPAGLWGRNVAAWLAGGLLALGAAAGARPRAARHLPWAAAMALAATFLGSGQEGVHRWVSAGPVSMNVAMLVLPAAVVALAAIPNMNGRAWLSAFACLGILVLQPDASQATAFGSAVAVIATCRARGRIAKSALVAATVILIAAAWLRPDPLAPVPEVEEIIELARSRSLLLAGLAWAVLAAVAAAPALGARRAPREIRVAATALSVCLALWVVTPVFGAFPVPLVGIGVSPILGAWIGVGLLAGLMRQPPAEGAPAQAVSRPAAAGGP